MPVCRPHDRKCRFDEQGREEKRRREKMEAAMRAQEATFALYEIPSMEMLGEEGKTLEHVSHTSTH